MKKTKSLSVLILSILLGIRDKKDIINVILVIFVLSFVIVIIKR